MIPPTKTSRRFVEISIHHEQVVIVPRSCGHVSNTREHRGRTGAHPGPSALVRINPNRDATMIPTPQNIPLTRHNICALSLVGRNSVTSAVVTGRLPPTPKPTIIRNTHSAAKDEAKAEAIPPTNTQARERTKALRRPRLSAKIDHDAAPASMPGMKHETREASSQQQQTEVSLSAGGIICTGNVCSLRRAIFLSERCEVRTPSK